jgi:hypothetical protein
MRLASLLVAAVCGLSAGTMWAQDSGDPRFGRTYVKACINVEIKGFLKAGKAQSAFVRVQELGSPPDQVWLLDIGKDEKLKELLSRLDGKMVVVTGTCGLRTLGLAGPREPAGSQPKEFATRVVGTAIDFDRNVTVTSVKEASSR